jgi:hypothetical protein
MFFSRIHEVECRTVEKSTLLVLVRIDDIEKQVKWNGL